MGGGLLGALRGAAKPVYLIVVATGRTDGEFPLRGYAGPSGRLDVAARTYLSILEDEFTLAALLLGPPGPPKMLLAPSKCRGSRVSGERGFMLQARLALKAQDSCFEAYELGSGVEGVDIASSLGPLVYLREGGSDVAEALSSVMDASVIAMGGHVDPPPEVDSRLRSRAKAVVSLGPQSFHSDHVAAFVSWLRTAFK